jgi:hypothetical protein
MKKILSEQIDWDVVSKDASTPSTGTTKKPTGTTKTTVTKPNKPPGGSKSDNNKPPGGSSKPPGGGAAGQLNKPGALLVSEADTIQSYIRTAYVAFSKLGPLTTAMNLDENLIHQTLINYIAKGSTQHITLKAQYLDFILRIANPASSLSSLIKTHKAAWDYVIKGKKGLTIQAIRNVPCLPSLQTFNDFINPASQLGNWLDAHDLTNAYVDKIFRTLEKSGIISFSENNGQITKTKFIKSKSSAFWDKKVTTLYEKRAYG